MSVFKRNNEFCSVLLARRKVKFKSHFDAGTAVTVILVISNCVEVHFRLKYWWIAL